MISRECSRIDILECFACAMWRAATVYRVLRVVVRVRSEVERAMLQFQKVLGGVGVGT